MEKSWEKPYFQLIAEGYKFPEVVFGFLEFMDSSVPSDCWNYPNMTNEKYC